jgi:hypothetical protein
MAPCGAAGLVAGKCTARLGGAACMQRMQYMHTLHSRAAVEGCTQSELAVDTRRVCVINGLVAVQRS